MRWLSLLLIISLFVACVIPASAASVPGQYDVVDLLASGFFSSTGLSVTSTSTVYNFSWEPTSKSSIYEVYVNIYAPTQPSSVSLAFGSRTVAGSLVYSGAFYQYRFSVSNVLSSCSVAVRFSSSANRTVSIGYAIGTVSGQEVFTTFNRRSRGFNSSSFGSSVSGAIPFTGRFSSTVSGSHPTSEIVNDFELQFTPSLDAADYATIHIVVPGGQVVAEDGFRTPWAVEPGFFLGSGWNHTYPLSVTHFDSFYDATATVGVGRGCWHYVYTVDVSGYKLTSKNILCCFSLIGVPGASTNQYLFNFDVLSSCVGINPDQGSAFRGFTGWLNTQLTNIKSAISSLGTTITNQFTSLKSSLSTWFTNLQNTIKNAINPPGETVPSDEFSDAAGGIDDFEQSQMDSIDSSMSQVQSTVSLAGIGTSLAFIQRYTNGIFSGLGDAALLFTFPLFLGIFFYLCSRVPNNTHHKKDGDSS